MRMLILKLEFYSGQVKKIHLKSQIVSCGQSWVGDT